MEWTRKELKEKAKFSVKAFYWKSVLVAFVLALISGGFGSGGSSGGGDSGDTTEITGNQFMYSNGSGKINGPAHRICAVVSCFISPKSFS